MSKVLFYFEFACPTQYWRCWRASELAARTVGKRSIAKTIRNIHECPLAALSSNFKKSNGLESSRQFSGNAVLASKSTIHLYKQTQKWSMKADHNICLSKSNQDRYPPKEYIVVIKTRAKQSSANYKWKSMQHFDRNSFVTALFVVVVAPTTIDER